MILGDVVDWFSRKNLPDNERIAVVIDRVESGARKRQRLIAESVNPALANTLRFPVVGTVTFGRSDELMPLQAADMVAHQAFQLVKRGPERQEQRLSSSRPLLLVAPMRSREYLNQR